jgi:acyl carrier protein
VKVRGYRIELGEIETALTESGMVKEAVVSMHEQSPGDRRLVAYVVGPQKNGYAESEQLQKSLRAYLRERVPDYMVPSSFMHLDAMPLTAHGKIDRQALPQPEYGRTERDVEFVAAGTEMEQAIAALWQEVLKIDQVSIHDNFFDLGGHSLLLAEIHNRLREMLKRDLPMVDLFRFATISTLSNYLSQDQTEESSLSQFQDRARMQREARRQKNQAKRRENA